MKGNRTSKRVFSLLLISAMLTLPQAPAAEVSAEAPEALEISKVTEVSAEAPSELPEVSADPASEESAAPATELTTELTAEPAAELTTELTDTDQPLADLDYYRVTYDANGGTCQREYVTGRGDVELWFNAPRRPGYNFEGWSLTQDGSDGVRVQAGGTIYVDHDLTVYAIWSPGEVMDPNAISRDYTAMIPYEKYSCNYTLTPEEDAVYEFISDSPDPVAVYIYNTAGDLLAFEGEWDGPFDFDLTYECKAGETYCIEVRFSEIEYTGGIPFTVKNLTAKPVIAGDVTDENYEFGAAGEYSEEEFTFVPAASGPFRFACENQGDYAVLHVFDPAEKMICYKSNSGDDSPVSDYAEFEAGEKYRVVVGSVGTCTLNVKRGYRISFNANGSWNHPDPEIQWHNIPLDISSVNADRSYYVRFDPRGGVAEQDYLQLKAPFLAWADTADGTGVWYNEEPAYVWNADTVLYAQYGEAYLEKLPGCTREGSIFRGWSLEKNNGALFAENSPVSSDFTLYAQWDGAPVILAQSQDVYAGINATVHFYVEASGNDLSYRWEYSKNGGAKWLLSNATGAETDTMSFKVSASSAGNIYRCRVMNAMGETVYSRPVGVELIPGAVITLNPQSQVAALGEYAIFTVEAEYAASYQWQYSKDGAHWYNSNAAGSLTDTLTVKGEQKSQGNRYRCVVTGIDGNKKKSLACAMIVLQKAPQNCSAAVGEQVTFSLKAEGIVSYQWQYSKDGGESWYRSSAKGNDTDTMSFAAAKSNVGNIYRCKLTTEDGAYAWTRPVGIV